MFSGLSQIKLGEIYLLTTYYITNVHKKIKQIKIKRT